MSPAFLEARTVPCFFPCSLGMCYITRQRGPVPLLSNGCVNNPSWHQHSFNLASMELNKHYLAVLTSDMKRSVRGTGCSTYVCTLIAFLLIIIWKSIYLSFGPSTMLYLSVTQHAFRVPAYWKLSSPKLYLLGQPPLPHVRSPSTCNLLRLPNNL